MAKKEKSDNQDSDLNNKKVIATDFLETIKLGSSREDILKNKKRNTISLMGLSSGIKQEDLLARTDLDIAKSIGIKTSPLVADYYTSLFENGINSRVSLNKLSDNHIKLEKENLELKMKMRELENLADKNDKTVEEYQKAQVQLTENKRNQHIINRIHPSAEEFYMFNEEFKGHFNHKTPVNAVVISIDIRRSTDLMLKAKTPNDYSDFITEVSSALSEIVINNFGIFDKFTGDGILAFFPDFYSEDDAIIRAIISADLCHQTFFEIYRKNRSKFSVFIKDVGLGIGIDYGTVSLVNSGTELTVVGKPVVYACRFSGAKAGETLMNTEAYELLESLDHPFIQEVIESEIFIKNEGTALAYRPILNYRKLTNLPNPSWMSEIDNKEESSGTTE